MKSTPLVPRRRLLAIELTGWQRVVNLALCAVLACAGVLAAIGFLIGRHRVSCFDCGHTFGAWHSYATELYGLPVLLPAAMVALSLITASRTRKRVLLGALHLVLGFGLFVLIRFTHFLDAVENTDGIRVGYVGLLGMMGIGLAQLVLWSVLAVIERDRLELADPVFPAAQARVSAGPRS